MSLTMGEAEWWFVFWLERLVVICTSSVQRVSLSFWYLHLSSHWWNEVGRFPRWISSMDPHFQLARYAPLVRVPKISRKGQCVLDLICLISSHYNMQFESNDSISSWLNMLHSLHWLARIAGKRKRENNKKKIDIQFRILDI